MSWISAKGECVPGMAAGAGRHRDQAVGALLDRLAREAVVDDVMHRHAAIGMDGGVDVLARAERRDDDRRLPFHAERDVLLETIVGLVDDLVDGERRGAAFADWRGPRRRAPR